MGYSQIGNRSKNYIRDLIRLSKLLRLNCWEYSFDYSTRRGYSPFSAYEEVKMAQLIADWRSEIFYSID